MRLGLPASLALHAALLVAVMLPWMSAPEILVAPPEDSITVDIVGLQRDMRAEENRPSPEQSTPQPEPETVEEAKPVPAETPRPPPPQKEKTKGRPLTDLRNLNEQINPDRDPVRDPRRGNPGTGTQLIASEADSIRRKVESCWREWSDIPDPQSIVVVVRVTFSATGAVQGRPEVLREQSALPPGGYTRVAIDRTVNAFLECQPFRMAANRTQPATHVFRFSPGSAQ